MILFVAGKRFSPWVTLEHTGRRSGRVYRTPLVTFPFGDGFVFMLPYGPGVEAADHCRRDGLGGVAGAGSVHDAGAGHLVAPFQ
jgi:hypothetical protein